MGEDLDSKKEKLIETLLIVVGFVLAGSYNSTNIFFLYTIFAFLTFAIMMRTFVISFSTGEKHGLLATLAILVSLLFPLIFITFFFMKGIIPTEGIPKYLTYVVLSILASLLSMSLSTSLMKGLRLNIFGTEFDINKIRTGVIILGLYFLIDVIAWCIIEKSDMQPIEYFVQNATIIVDNSSVIITNNII